MSEVEVSTIIAKAACDSYVKAIKAAPQKYSYRAFRQQAFDIIAALDAAGYVIVPREPTDAMIEAGVSRLAEEGIIVVDRDPLFVWRAMLHEAAKP